jgi:hypothetical protein
MIIKLINIFNILALSEAIYLAVDDLRKVKLNSWFENQCRIFFKSFALYQAIIYQMHVQSEKLLEQLEYLSWKGVSEVTESQSQG